jgi:hypothetical protein
MEFRGCRNFFRKYRKERKEGKGRKGICKYANLN